MRKSETQATTRIGLMARIEGVDLPRNKRVEVGLTYIFGIGNPHAQQILTVTGVNPDTRVKDLTDAEVGLLRDYIGQHYKVEGDLRRSVQMNIKRLIEIGSYRGFLLPPSFTGGAPTTTT